MRKTTFFKLIDKYIQGNASSAEQKLLEEYYQRLDAKELTSLTPEQEQSLKQIMHENILQRMHVSLPGKEHRKVRYLFRYTAAASILLLISTGLYFYSKQPLAPQLVKQSLPIKTDLAPGGNKAVLTLSNGAKIVLDDRNNGLLAKQNGITVRKAADGMIIYDIAKPGTQVQDVAYNTIETPRGGQFQVNLPDGSKVWLNAASSLKFPVIFTDKGRDVELTGEAYFEIAKNKNAPFKVRVNTAEIEVLGTHFNVMAYTEERSINTTLLEGSVRVSAEKQSRLIVPGQQLKLTDKMEVVKADISEAIAWKNGYFIFKNEEISSVMRKISRWYDVDIQYKNGIPKKKFLGKISRNGNVSEVLEILELTGAVHFKIDKGNSLGAGRRITVMP